MLPKSPPKIYFAIVILRAVYVLFSEHSYIHPDEFFQTSEIVAGEMLDIKSTRTWEFNQTSPLRSIVPIMLFTGIPYVLIRALALIIGREFVNASNLLIFPRLYLQINNILSELLLFKIAQKLNLDSDNSVLLLATSYITWTFGSRTLSNNYETYLFVLMLYFLIITKDLTHWDRGKAKREINPKRYNNKDIWALAFVCVAGFWNRPTFACFSFVPLLAWIMPLSSSRSEITNVVNKALQLGLKVVLFGFIFIFIDSLYYGSFTNVFSDDIEILIDEIGFNSFTITPLNFILYNTKTINLKEHGLHPRYLNVFVNLPMLFNVLIVFILHQFVFVFRTLVSKAKFVYSDYLQLVLISSFCFPLFVLSVIPHQEPRFIVPLIIPVVLISARPFYRSLPFTKTFLLCLWFFFNIICGFFFGNLHQGGVTPCIKYLQENVVTHTRSQHVIFHQTYMPPTHLFAIPNDSLLNLHDVKGMSEANLTNYIQGLNGYTNKVDDDPSHMKSDIYIASSMSLSDICHSENWHLELVHSFYWHLSTEILQGSMHRILKVFKSSNLLDSIQALNYEFSLKLYKVKVHLS